MIVNETARVEHIILENLVKNEDFSRQVLPFLKAEYFERASEKLVFKIIEEFINTHNSLPSLGAIQIEIGKSKGINETVYDAAMSLIDTGFKGETHDKVWLTHTTEEFCRLRALYIAMSKSIAIIEDPTNAKEPLSIIPEIMTEALGVSFETAIGHSYLDDFAARFASYHDKTSRIASGLSMVDKIMGGGAKPKTLNCFLAGTGVGKSLTLCSIAANVLLSGKNVLYITLEMAEDKIAERIDANLLDIDLDDFPFTPPAVLEKKFKSLKAKHPNIGNVIVKEYPTGGAHAGHFRFLIRELRLKQNFVPDLIIVDYLNICASARIKGGSNVNSYTYHKTVAEELRGLMIECNVPGWTATQTNRSGFASDDVGMTDTSESFGVPMTLDLMMAIMTNADLDQQGLFLFKQLKNRYTDVSKNSRFVVGVKKARMRLFDVVQPAAIANSSAPTLGTQGVTGTQTTLTNQPAQSTMSSKSNGSPGKPPLGSPGGSMRGKIDKTKLTDIKV